MQEKSHHRRRRRRRRRHHHHILCRHHHQMMESNNIIYFSYQTFGFIVNEKNHTGYNGVLKWGTLEHHIMIWYD